MTRSKKKKVKLRNLTPLDLSVACDHFEEHGPLIPQDWFVHKPPKISSTACFLRYPTPPQEEVLKKRLPHVMTTEKVWMGGGIGYNRPVRRKVVVYPLVAIKHILKFLGMTAPSECYTLIYRSVENSNDQDQEAARLAYSALHP